MTDDNVATTQGRIVTEAAHFVSTSVNRPKLLRIDAESIWVFIQLYGQYKNEVTACAQQLTAAESTTTELIRPVNLKFFVDPETIESALALDFIEGFDEYEALTDSALRTFLKEKSQESKDSLTSETLDSIVRSELNMDMHDKNAKSRIESLFLSCCKLLCRHDIAWLLKSSQKVAVYHVLSAVKPKSLHDRLESDLDFAFNDCRKDFSRFTKHATRLQEAFQVLHNSPKPKRDDIRNTKPKRSGNNDNSKSQPPGSNAKSSQTKGVKSLKTSPTCPHGPCQRPRDRHWIRDCEHSTDAEKSSMLADIATARAKDGPSRSTHSQSSDKRSETFDTNGGKHRSTVGRMTKPQPVNSDSDDSLYSTCPITVSNGRASISATGVCDD